ncbi:MAG: amidohydrolase family protein, partial [Bacteroidales bacterium]|nr:amidohydrolase family protein [Bacteroidales bacterium]
SNLKLASGYKFRYDELKNAGVNVCIGTDGAASSNNMDILEALKTSALVQKAWTKDPTALPIPELLNMATVNGAKALGINSGKIEEGYLADINIVNTDSSFFLSPGSFEANLIYSAHSDCIESMIAGGQFVMKNHIIPGEKEILQRARAILREIQ